jgi:2',3'-cyclic-nucleotide 2'-phosphodiesterase (5'-nucleotidase family)
LALTLAFEEILSTFAGHLLSKAIMNMQNTPKQWLVGILLVSVLMAAGCRSTYLVTNVEGTEVAMDSTLDAHPDAQAVALLAPYKAHIDSMMYRVLGTAAMDMERARPESLLSNLVADVLRQSAIPVLGQKADIGIMNIGGLRSNLSKGNVTVDNIYEILPFENTLCILTIKGHYVRQLFHEIASIGGEGLSGAQLVISKDHQLISATIAGKPIDDDALYTVATIDYLADGNDKLTALIESEKRVCPEGSILRTLFISYTEQQTKLGKPLTSKLEGRIIVQQ